MEQLKVTVATVTQKLVDSECSGVVLPTKLGQIEILPGHAALLTQIEPGLVRVKGADSDHTLVVGEGFAQVDHNHLRVVVEQAGEVAKLDRAKVENEQAQLKTELENHELSDRQIESLQKRLLVTKAQLHALNIQ